MSPDRTWLPPLGRAVSLPALGAAGALGANTASICMLPVLALDILWLAGVRFLGFPCWIVSKMMVSSCHLLSSAGTTRLNTPLLDGQESWRFTKLPVEKGGTWQMGLAGHLSRPRLSQALGSSSGWDSQVPASWLCGAAKPRTSNCAFRNDIQRKPLPCCLHRCSRAWQLVAELEQSLRKASCLRFAGSWSEMNLRRRRTCSVLQV